MALLLVPGCAPESTVPEIEPSGDTTLGRTTAASAEETPPDAPPLNQRCSNAQHGFSIAYPAGWHTNSGAVIPACSAFHPEPFEIPVASEMPFEIAVLIDVEPVSIEQLREESKWEEILSAERLTIAGREVWGIEVRATGEGLAERGMRTLRYAIDRGGGQTLLAATHDAHPDYDPNRKVLRQMIETLNLAE